MQLMSMYPMYPDSLSLVSILPRVSRNTVFGWDQYIRVPISPVDGPISPGNIRLCSKFTQMGVMNSLPLKNVPTAISTPLAYFWSWNTLIFLLHLFL